MVNGHLTEIVEKLRGTLEIEPPPSQPVIYRLVQDIVADVPAVVLVADGNGQLVAASRQALHLLDHTLASLRGLNVTELAAVEDEPHGERLWESFLQQRRQSGHFALQRRGGGTIRTQYVARANVVAGLSVAVHVPQ